LDDFSSALAYNIADRVGLEFKNSNPDSDILIATCLPASEKCISVILGILKTGAGYLPLDPEYPEQLLLDVLLIIVVLHLKHLSVSSHYFFS